MNTGHDRDHSAGSARAMRDGATLSFGLFDRACLSFR